LWVRPVVPSIRIERVHIHAFKSIADQTLELGRLNVLVGANGSGKSALMEALGVLGAAISGRIDDTSLMRRGVRLGALRLYKSAFKGLDEPWVYLSAEAASVRYSVHLDAPVDSPDRAWSYGGELVEVGGHGQPYLSRSADAADLLTHRFDIDPTRGAARTPNPFGKTPPDFPRMLDTLERFALFDPQTPILRGTQADPMPTDPLGLGGGKLAEAVRALLLASPDRFGLMPRDDLFELLGWASDVAVGPPSPDLSSPAIPAATEIVRFVDRYLHPEEHRNVLSGYDASEGALYVLFVLALLFHPLAPPFFAIENIEHTLHPRLARKLVEILARYVAPADRQILVTTHNPLVLDALPLADDAIRLFAVDRNASGHTVVRRIVHSEAMEAARESR
jgi:energy-coupling factor transporter ATP-binding protein EcfA2